MNKNIFFSLSVLLIGITIGYWINLPVEQEFYLTKRQYIERAKHFPKINGGLSRHRESMIRIKRLNPCDECRKYHKETKLEEAFWIASIFDDETLNKMLSVAKMLNKESRIKKERKCKEEILIK